MKKAFLIFSLILIFYSTKSQNTKYQNLDSLIYSVIDDVSVDSVKSYIQHLQNYGNRDFNNPNRKQIAIWIANKFKSWDYNVELDSFKILKAYFNPDSLMQYNVVATKKGIIDSTKIYILGGHYDTYFNPGADDNASGTSTTLEVARIMSKNNYQNPYTFRFIAFAAEETMLSPGGSGCEYAAKKSKKQKENIQLMINNDMVSHDPDTTWKIDINEYTGSEWASMLAYYAANKYTLLKPIIKYQINQASDSYPYWQQGFPSTYYEEGNFSSQHYHQASDTIGNFNMKFCSEVAKADAAMLIHEMEFPVQNINKINNNCTNITLNFNMPHNNLLGYNIYRSLNPDSNFAKINQNIVIDTVFVDNNIEEGILYWYKLSSVNTNLNEILFSNTKMGSSICKDKGILIVDDSEGGLLNPHDTIIDKYYSNLLQGYKTTQYSVIPGKEIPLTKLGQYSTIFWHLNNNSYSSSASSLKYSSQNIEKYLQAGGNFFLSTYKPANYIIQQFIDDNILKNSIAYKYLKIDTIINSSYLNNAIACNNEFSSIKVDSLKLPSTYNGILREIKSIRPTPEADTLLVSSTYYANNTAQGQYNGNPVAIGYFGEDYKTVTLSFPLYYMDFAQSKVFVDKILHEKFHEVVGIKEIEHKDKAGFIMQLYPNPCINDLYVRYNLKKQSNVSLEIYNSNGIKVFETNSQTKSSGENYQWLYNLNLPEGLYVLILKTNEFVDSQKFIIKK